MAAHPSPRPVAKAAATPLPRDDSSVRADTTSSFDDVLPGRFVPARLVFFSDAVMAIAITLLVIDLRVPDLGAVPTEAGLEAALRDLAPQFFAFLLSFAVIAVWWNSHHRLFGLLAVADGRILFLDLVFLAGVAFLPFPTSLIGRYPALAASVILYATTNVVIGLASYGMWRHASRGSLLATTVDQAAIDRRLRYMAIGPIVFALSIPIAMVEPRLAVLSWNLVWIVLVAWRLAVRRRQGARRA